MPAPVLRALLRCELLQCPWFPSSALSSQLLTLRHPSARTPRVYTSKNISENSSEFFKHCSYLQGNSLGFPSLQGITSHHKPPKCFSIACTCGAIWCDVIPSTPWLLRVNKALTRPAPSLLLLPISSHTEHYKVELMSSPALAISLAVCFIDMMRQLFTKMQPSQRALTFSLSSMRNPVIRQSIWLC